MARIKKEIIAVLHLPESEHAIRRFEKKICDFYVVQVEQRLQSLPKEKKLEVLDAMLSSYNKQTNSVKARNNPTSVADSSLLALT